MNNRHFVVPSPKGYDQAYELAYKLAGEQLAKLDIERQCQRAGAQYQVIHCKTVITVQYLNQTYAVTQPDVEVSLATGAEEVPIRDRILILHYLVGAKGTPPSNRPVTYKELPGGNTYFPTFSKRTTRPILNNFGNEPKLLAEVAKKLGGYRVNQGDVAVTINAFSRVPITIVVWRGDDEFPPEGNILFDANISDYLSSEDITTLCETIVWKMVNYLKEMRAKPAG
jgi:hypothetical protein